MRTSLWSDGVLESLPALHTISGCDVVIIVNKKRTTKWLNTVQRKGEYSQGVSQLGDTIRINANVFQKIKSHQLAPTKDELTQHIRANYKTYPQKRFLDNNLDIPSPVGIPLAFHSTVPRGNIHYVVVDGKSPSPRISARTCCLNMP